MKILIGEVLRPQGIQGEIKISNFTDGFEQIKNIKSVYIDDKKFPVLKLSQRDNALFMFLGGIYTRDAAEVYRGKNVYCEREELEVSSDSFFIEDIIGCSLKLSSGKLIGTVKDVTSSSTDIFVLDTSEGEAYMPFIKELNANIDIENRQITVDAKKFTEVVLYKEQK